MFLGQVKDFFGSEGFLVGIEERLNVLDGDVVASFRVADARVGKRVAFVDFELAEERLERRAGR